MVAFVLLTICCTSRIRHKTWLRFVLISFNSSTLTEGKYMYVGSWLGWIRCSHFFLLYSQFHGSQRTKQLEIFEFSRADYHTTFPMLYNSQESKMVKSLLWRSCFNKKTTPYPSITSTKSQKLKVYNWFVFWNLECNEIDWSAKPNGNEQFGGSTDRFVSTCHEYEPGTINAVTNDSTGRWTNQNEFALVWNVS